MGKNRRMGGRTMNEHVKVWHHAGEKTKPPYHYTGCGLDDVYLASGYDIEEGNYGRGVRIRNLDKLREAIGLYLVVERKLLNGKELRYLRQQMNLTQTELARFIGCGPQQIARYEKEANVPGPADRMIRLMYKDHVSTKGVNIRKVLNCLDGLDDVRTDKMIFTVNGDGWKKAAFA